jgi:hypothetical protein
MCKRTFAWVLSLFNVRNLVIEIVVDNTLDIVISDTSVLLFMKIADDHVFEM